MWLEPPYPPGRDGVSVTVGVFEALSCGVSGCLDWGRTFCLQQDRYRKLKGLLRGADSLVDTAVYIPDIIPSPGKYQREVLGQPAGSILERLQRIAPVLRLRRCR